MQCNSTRFTTGTLLNFLGCIKNYPACRPAACKKFQQSRLGKYENILKEKDIAKSSGIPKTVIHSNKKFMKRRGRDHSKRLIIIDNNGNYLLLIPIIHFFISAIQSYNTSVKNCHWSRSGLASLLHLDHLGMVYY